MKKLIVTTLALITLNAGWLDQLKSAAGDYIQTPTQKADPKSQSAIKQALELGVQAAISSLGKKDGFYKSPFKIPLPPSAQRAASLLQSVGMGEYVKKFELSMNRAAEEAIPESASVLMETIKQMKLEDAKRLIQSDNPTAITDYFKKNAGKKLSQKLAPIIKKHMETENVTRYYETMMHYYDKYAKNYTSNEYAQAALTALGMNAPKEKDLSSYVTNQALDALYKVIAQKEQAIRTSAAARTTQLLQEVFGGATK